MEAAPGEDWRQAQQRDAAARASQELSSIPGTATGPTAGRAPPHSPPDSSTKTLPSQTPHFSDRFGCGRGSSLQSSLLCWVCTEKCCSSAALAGCEEEIELLHNQGVEVHPLHPQQPFQPLSPEWFEKKLNQCTKTYSYINCTVIFLYSQVFSTLGHSSRRRMIPGSTHSLRVLLPIHA